MRSLADFLMLVGALLLVVGVALRFAPGLLSWFGRLPGDIRIEGERTRIYIPVTTMILLSLGLTVLLNLLVRLRR